MNKLELIGGVLLLAGSIMLPSPVSLHIKSFTALLCAIFGCVMLLNSFQQNRGKK
jgi:hypothetical protein